MVVLSRRFHLHTAVTLAVMLLSGCAHHDATFSPAAAADDGRALVYIYRPAQISNVMLSPTVVIDGEAVFDTQTGAYVVLSIAAGTHRFILDSEQHLAGNDELLMQLGSGRVSYLRIDSALQFETGKPYTRSFGIVRVDAPTALDEIASCRHQQARLPSKYLWPAAAPDTAADEAQAVEPATFTIEKSGNPFAAKRSRE